MEQAGTLIERRDGLTDVGKTTLAINLLRTDYPERTFKIEVHPVMECTCAGMLGPWSLTISGHRPRPA